jgi:hypothetical protein
MHPSDHPTPSIGKLFSSWLSLTFWIVRACTATAKQQTTKVVRAVNDKILDMGNGSGNEALVGQAGPQPLPPLLPAEFVAAMRGRVDAMLYRTAEMINEDSCGCWTEVTVDRVAALFDELAQEALVQALELRVAAEETRLGQPDSAGEWVKKFRRMLAAEGRWPPGADCQDRSRT